MEEKPGTAAAPSEFMQGKHTMPQTRSNPLGIKMLFDTVDHATKRMVEAKNLDLAVSDANWRAAQERRAQRRQQRQESTEAVAGRDPWEDRKPVRQQRSLPLSRRARNYLHTLIPQKAPHR